jgi:hypothetical protein
MFSNVVFQTVQRLSKSTVWRHIESHAAQVGAAQGAATATGPGTATAAARQGAATATGASQGATTAGQGGA